MGKIFGIAIDCGRSSSPRKRTIYFLRGTGETAREHWFDSLLKRLVVPGKRFIAQGRPIGLLLQEPTHSVVSGFYVPKVKGIR
jgi:hypothetical protein